MRRAVTGADRVVLYVIVGAGIALLFLPGGGGGARVAVVEGDGGFRQVLPLSEDAVLEVPGPLGSTVVEVSDGGASVRSSPCPEKLCVSMGEADEAGEAVVCVPNGVVVRVEGGAGRGPDATTR